LFHVEAMGKVLVGSCGFRMKRSEQYRTFPVSELQQPFYQPPRESTARRWREEAPADFVFTLKAFQAITHPPQSPTYRRSRLSATERRQCGDFRDTKAVRRAWETTRRLAAILEAPFVVFQCPARFKPTPERIENLRRFFSEIERDDLLLGWEPRGEAWSDQRIRALCRELDLIHVVDPFVRKPVRGTPRYFRLHGIGGYHHQYTDGELRRLHAMCTAARTYVLFNNVSMAEDAQRFQAMGAAR
jgi:uncharacterized protein YecE (DUF72 family)